MITKAALCLASVIYAEARGEPVDGQIAVAQVVINRVFDPRWPDDVCQVAHQPAQFATLTPDARTVDLAVQILNFEHDDVSGGATHFFSGSPPWWAQKLDYVGKIAGHTFMVEHFPKSRLQVAQVEE